MRNLQVYDPTTSKLNVRWEPAEGNVREYIITWAPTTGGVPTVVRSRDTLPTLLPSSRPG